MKTVFETGDRVQITNSNLDSYGEEGTVRSTEELGHNMYLYKVKIDGGKTIKVDGPSVDVA